MNSASESGVKAAVNSAICLLLFVSLNETLAVLCRTELMCIISSSFGSVASKVIRNLIFLFLFKLFFFFKKKPPFASCLSYYIEINCLFEWLKWSKFSQKY